MKLHTIRTNQAHDTQLEFANLQWATDGEQALKREAEDEQRFERGRRHGEIASRQVQPEVLLVADDVTDVDERTQPVDEVVDGQRGQVDGRRAAPRDAVTQPDDRRQNVAGNSDR